MCAEKKKATCFKLHSLSVEMIARVNAQSEVPSLPPVALGLRAAEDSAGFLGTLGTLKAAWDEEDRFPSTLSSSSKLRSNRRETESRLLAMHRHRRQIGLQLFFFFCSILATVVTEFPHSTANHYVEKQPVNGFKKKTKQKNS